MTTLNARANQAWRENSQIGHRGWPFTADEGTQFKRGWELGYKAAVEDFDWTPEVYTQEEARLLGVAVREFADKHGIPLPEEDSDD